MPEAEFSSVSETGSQDKPSYSSLKLSKQHKSWSYLVGLFMLFKAYKAKAFGFSSGICHHFNTQSFTCYQGAGLVKYQMYFKIIKFHIIAPALKPQSDPGRDYTVAALKVPSFMKFTASIKAFLYLPYLPKSSFSLSSSMSSPKFLI